jgi:hypothetical protein
MTTENSLMKRIESRLDQLDALMRSQDYDGAYELIPNILKFDSILTEDQVEFARAAKYAIENKIDWKP